MHDLFLRHSFCAHVFSCFPLLHAPFIAPTSTHLFHYPHTSVISPHTFTTTTLFHTPPTPPHPQTPEEIRETFNLPDDLTEEEKLEPVKAPTEDPRIRLLNKYYAKKRRELQLRKAPLEDPGPPAATEDTRTLEELLDFIEEPKTSSEYVWCGSDVF